jgi:hypothetical protein
MMKRRILIALSALALAGASFATCRASPAHHYQQLGQSRYLYDQSTGSVCSSVKETGSTALDHLRSQMGLPVPSTVPQCGTE